MDATLSNVPAFAQYDLRSKRTGTRVVNDANMNFTYAIPDLHGRSGFSAALREVCGHKSKARISLGTTSIRDPTAKPSSSECDRAVTATGL
jgi:hypothetical protein